MPNGIGGGGGPGMPSAVMQAMLQGAGGASVPPGPPVSQAFREPGGIPDPRAALPQFVPPAGPDVRDLLRSGAVSADELLQLIAMLAGLGGAPQTGGETAPPETVQAFLGE